MTSSFGYSLVAIVMFAGGIVADLNDAPGHAVAIFIIGGIAYSCTSSILRALGK